MKIDARDWHKVLKQHFRPQIIDVILESVNKEDGQWCHEPMDV